MLFSEVCEIFEKVRGTSSKNLKVSFLAKLLKSLNEEELSGLIKYMLGCDVGVGWATIRDAVLEVAKEGEKFGKVVVEKGDLGEAAYELLKGGKKVTPFFFEELQVMDVINALNDMGRIKGQGSQVLKKRKLIGLLLRADPLEAKYIVKFLTNELRIGATSGLLEEAIALAYGYRSERIREAVLMVADLSKVAVLAKERRIDEAKPSLFSPIGFMLAEPAPSAEEAMKKFGKEVLVEYKYDGIRAQVHVGRDGVRIFSRRLEDVTDSFPELVEDLRKLGFSAIFDGEILAYRDGRPVHFTKLQQRLHRKRIDEKVIKEVPVHYFIFDILMYEGREMMSTPLRDRKKLLESLKLGGRIHLAPIFTAKDPSRVEELFNESRKLGYEGLMLKDPDSIYTPGRRGAKWMKLKRELDTIDAVVVAVEYGHGKRAGLLSDYTFAVWDGDELKVIGKAYSGLTDEEIEEMTEYFKKKVIEWRGSMAIVEPEIVVEVAFDSVQKSDRHDSGYALRFPRIKAIRWDKAPRDADTLDKVKMIYERSQEA